MSLFDKVFLKRTIRLPNGVVLKRGTSYAIEMESDKEVCLRMPNNKGKWIQKVDCLIDFNQLGPFRGATLTK